MPYKSGAGARVRARTYNISNMVDLIVLKLFVNKTEITTINKKIINLF